jgi:hypothetical protein
VDPALDAALDAFGVTATVTPPGGAPIVTRGIWLHEVSDASPTGREFQARSPRRVMALPVADVGTLARGATILAPEPFGTTVLTWATDGVELVEGDEIRVVVRRSGG